MRCCSATAEQILERDILVSTYFTGQTQDALCDDVFQDLVRATRDAQPRCVQIVSMYGSSQRGVFRIVDEAELILQFDQLIGPFLQTRRGDQLADRRFMSRGLAARNCRQLSHSREPQSFRLYVPERQPLPEGGV